MLTRKTQQSIIYTIPTQQAPARNYLQEIIQGASLVFGGVVAVTQGLDMIDRTLEEAGILPQCAPDRRSPLRS
jgi:hypothetical protein